jgi:hypothetical protein
MGKHIIRGEARDLRDAEALPDDSERAEVAIDIDLSMLTAIDVNADGSGHTDDLRTALAAAPDGATITIHGGSWPGPFFIDKNVVLVGKDGARLRPELPAEIGVRLAPLHQQAEAALAFFATWALPRAMVNQLKENVTVNPFKKRRISALKDTIASDEHEERWRKESAPLVALEDALYDQFIVVDGCSVIMRDVHIGFDEHELALFESNTAELAVPSGMRRDRRRVVTFDNNKGARTPFVDWPTAEKWLDEHGFTAKDVRASEYQHGYRAEKLGLEKTAPIRGDDYWERGWWDDVGGLLEDVCRSVPRASVFVEWRELSTLSALRDGRRPKLNSPMVSFSANSSDDALVLQNCVLQSHGMYPLGIHAMSTDTAAKLILDGCTLEGIRSDYEFKKKESVWSHVNAAIYVDWPPCDRKAPPVALRDCTISGGFVGMDIAGGAIDASDCTFENNTAAGVRAFGSSKEPERAFARVTNSKFKQQSLAGVFGFRMDEHTLNLATSGLTFDEMGLWEVGALKSAEHRQEQKRQAELVKKRQEELQRRTQEEAARKREAEARRKAEAEIAAKARRASIAAANAAAEAAAKAKLAAVHAKGPVPHPKHPNVQLHPDGKLKPSPGFVWRSSAKGDFRVIPKPKPRPKQVEQPAGLKRVQNVRGCNIRCDDPECGKPIRTKLYFWAGRKFPDNDPRGWFCSLGCLNRCESLNHYGMPHSDFEAGDVIATLPDEYDFTLYDEHNGEVLVPSHTKMVVASDQYIARGQHWGTNAGDVDEYYAVTVRYQGVLYAYQAVSAFYLVKKGKRR